VTGFILNTGRFALLWSQLDQVTWVAAQQHWQSYLQQLRLRACGSGTFQYATFAKFDFQLPHTAGALASGLLVKAARTSALPLFTDASHLIRSVASSCQTLRPAGDLPAHNCPLSMSPNWPAPHYPLSMSPNVPSHCPLCMSQNSRLLRMSQLLVSRLALSIPATNTLERRAEGLAADLLHAERPPQHPPTTLGQLRGLKLPNLSFALSGISSGAVPLARCQNATVVHFGPDLRIMSQLGLPQQRRTINFQATMPHASAGLRSTVFGLRSTRSRPRSRTKHCSRIQPTLPGRYNYPRSFPKPRTQHCSRIQPVFPGHYNPPRSRPTPKTQHCSTIQPIFPGCCNPPSVGWLQRPPAQLSRRAPALSISFTGRAPFPLLPAFLQLSCKAFCSMKLLPKISHSTPNLQGQTKTRSCAGLSTLRHATEPLLSADTSWFNTRMTTSMHEHSAVHAVSELPPARASSSLVPRIVSRQVVRHRHDWDTGSMPQRQMKVASRSTAHFLPRRHSLCPRAVLPHASCWRPRSSAEHEPEGVLTRQPVAPGELLTRPSACLHYRMRDTALSFMPPRCVTRVTRFHAPPALISSRVRVASTRSSHAGKSGARPRPPVHTRPSTVLNATIWLGAGPVNRTVAIHQRQVRSSVERWWPHNEDASGEVELTPRHYLLTLSLSCAPKLVPVHPRRKPALTLKSTWELSFHPVQPLDSRPHNQPPALYLLTGGVDLGTDVLASFNALRAFWPVPSRAVDSVGTLRRAAMMSSRQLSTLVIVRALLSEAQSKIIGGWSLGGAVSVAVSELLDAAGCGLSGSASIDSRAYFPFTAQAVYGGELFRHPVVDIVNTLSPSEFQHSAYSMLFQCPWRAHVRAEVATLEESDEKSYLDTRHRRNIQLRDASHFTVGIDCAWDIAATLRCTLVTHSQCGMQQPHV